MKAGSLSLKGESLRYLVYLLFAFCWLVVASAVRGYGTLDHFLYIVQFAGILGIVSAGQTWSS